MYCLNKKKVSTAQALKEKLSELDEPTIPAFSTLIDAHLKAKATSGGKAVFNKAFKPLINKIKGKINRAAQV